MATTYPSQKQLFTDPLGTNLLSSPDHAGLHTDKNDTIEAIEDTLGTTAGTSVLKNFAAGQFPVRNTGGGATGTLVQTLVGGTLSASVVATPTVQNFDGWIDAAETWTYASASTITVPAGAASKYAIGDRIKWTQTTVKYGVITAVADTLLTIAVNTDYTVANAAISANFYSHDISPIGYPHWFNYAPTWGGFSVNPSNIIAKFAVNGRTCFVAINTGTGTSNATNFTISAPIAFGFGADHNIGSFTFAEDNGSGVTAPGRINLSTTTLTLNKDLYTGTWTASGNKRAHISISYQI